MTQKTATTIGGHGDARGAAGGPTRRVVHLAAVFVVAFLAFVLVMLTGSSASAAEGAAPRAEQNKGRLKEGHHKTTTAPSTTTPVEGDASPRHSAPTGAPGRSASESGPKASSTAHPPAAETAPPSTGRPAAETPVTTGGSDARTAGGPTGRPMPVASDTPATSGPGDNTGRPPVPANGDHPQGHESSAADDKGAPAAPDTNAPLPPAAPDAPDAPDTEDPDTAEPAAADTDTPAGSQANTPAAPDLASDVETAPNPTPPTDADGPVPAAAEPAERSIPRYTEAPVTASTPSAAGTAAADAPAAASSAPSTPPRTPLSGSATSDGAESAVPASPSTAHMPSKYDATQLPTGGLSPDLLDEWLRRGFASTTPLLPGSTPLQPFGSAGTAMSPGPDHPADASGYPGPVAHDQAGTDATSTRTTPSATSQMPGNDGNALALICGLTTLAQARANGPQRACDDLSYQAGNLSVSLLNTLPAVAQDVTSVATAVVSTGLDGLARPTAPLPLVPKILDLIRTSTAKVSSTVAQITTRTSTTVRDTVATKVAPASPKPPVAGDVRGTGPMHTGEADLAGRQGPLSAPGATAPQMTPGISISTPTSGMPTQVGGHADTALGNTQVAVSQAQATVQRCRPGS